MGLWLALGTGIRARARARVRVRVRVNPPGLWSACATIAACWPWSFAMANTFQ